MQEKPIAIENISYLNKKGEFYPFANSQYIYTLEARHGQFNWTVSIDMTEIYKHNANKLPVLKKAIWLAFKEENNIGDDITIFESVDIKINTQHPAELVRFANNRPENFNKDFPELYRGDR